jgi:hypothetical protein
MTFCWNPLSRSLLGPKRTCRFARQMSANDPKRTSTPFRSPPRVGTITFQQASGGR